MEDDNTEDGVVVDILYKSRKFVFLKYFVRGVIVDTSVVVLICSKI